MKKYDLGKITKIEDLRSIWPNEAQDFSKWLAQKENLDMLGNAIGIEIHFEEGESAVGSFSVDLFATEEGTGRKIVIENQLEDTDHNHLGKIITYASGKGAEVVVWIVKRARDEHRKAIEWLNNNTGENIGFFLLEIELWQIDGSKPAPMFNVVEQPNEWAKSMKSSEELTETKKLQLEFWQEFSAYAFTKEPFKKIFGKRKPAAQHWYDLALGSSNYHLVLTVSPRNKEITNSIYIQDNKQLFDDFKQHKNDIESDYGKELEWHEAKIDCRITDKASAVLSDKSKWQEAFEWHIATALKFKEIVKKYDK